MIRGTEHAGAAEDALTSSGRVVVLTGPAGSGKTAAALELYRRRLDGIGRPGCLLIVPNALAAEQACRRLLDESPAGVLIAPAVTTFANLAGGILAAAGAEAGPLSAVQRRLLLEGIVAGAHAGGKLEALSALADTPGLIDALDAGIAELKRAAVEPDALAAAIDPRSGRDGDLLTVYRLYQDRLVETRRSDLEGRMWLARNVLAGDGDAALGFPDVTAVAVDGFTDFTPTQLEILALLAGRVDKLLVTLPLADEPARERMWFWTARTLERIVAALTGAQRVSLAGPGPMAGLFDLTEAPGGSNKARPPAGPTLTILEAPDLEAEVRAVAGAIKADLASGAAAGSVAVMARNLEAYREPIERIFAACGIPVAAPSAALSECSVVRYVLSLLALPDAYEYHDVLAVIRSSYFRPAALSDEFDRTVTATAEMAVRSANVLGGRGTYAEALARLAALARGREAPADDEDDGFRLGPLATDAEGIERAAAMLEALFAQLDRPAGAKDTAQYARAVRELLATLEVAQAAAAGEDDAVVAADLRALQAFDALLDELAGADVGPAPVGGRAELLARCAAVAAAPPAGGEALVTVADVLDARALRFDRAYLLGVNEREFPTLTRERCFINESDRAAWARRGVVLDRRSDMIAREMLLLYLAATRAGEALTVSYTTAEASGKGRSVSGFVDELVSAARRAGVEAARRRIPPGQFVPPIDELAGADDAFNAAIVSAFEGGSRAKGLLAWAAGERGELLRRTSFGILAAHRRWTEGEPDAFDGRIDSPPLLEQLARRIPDEWTFSATEFNSYARCPWQFFARYLLDLVELDEPAARMTPAGRGLFCHEVLWRVMTDLRDRGGGEVDLAAVDESDLRAALAAAVEAERDRLAGRAVHTGLWVAQTRAWGELLWRYLLWQREQAVAQPDDRPLYFELAFGPTGMREGRVDPASRAEPVEVTVGAHAIRLQGKIDRVDRIAADGPGGLLAVDYKTGVVPPAVEIVTARDLQLALYVRALEVMFDEPCAGGAYHDVRANIERPASIRQMPRSRAAVPPYAEWLAASMAAAGRCVDGMRAGRFDALPVHGCPSRCAYRQVCHYSERRARRKTAPADGTGEGGHE